MIEQPLPEKRQTDNGTHLYLKAKSFLGVDLTPSDEVPDYVACVSQFQELYRRTFGVFLGFGATLYSTRALKDYLLKAKEVYQIDWSDTLPGDICLFSTGEGKPGARGHVFVCGKEWWMSNTSATGKWEANYVKGGVDSYFIKKLGFKPYIFRLK